MSLELRVDTALAAPGPRSFPAAHPPGHPESRAVHPSVPTQPFLDVLVIDDDRDTRTLLDCLCTDAGYRVDHAGSGAAGLAIAAATSPRLVVLDIHMPDMDGLTVARYLRALTPTTAVLAMTADMVLLDRADIQFPLVAKPFAFDALMAQIMALLRPRPS
ncbi:MAG TPA: response regulator [Herpetosiphonaceae bacterium]|nr:response regulator [Herpetosiphonaceae bacterium]